jgi:aspartate aminotransferase
MTKLQSQSTSSTAHMVQMAGLAAVPGPQDCVEKMKKDYVQLRDLTLGHLSLIPDVTCVKPEGAFYVYPNVSAYFG